MCSRMRLLSKKAGPGDPPLQPDTFWDSVIPPHFVKSSKAISSSVTLLWDEMDGNGFPMITQTKSKEQH